MHFCSKTWRQSVASVPTQLFNDKLARPAEHEVLLRFLIYLFLAISVRLIISTSTRQIFAKFSGLVELWLQMKSENISFRSLNGHNRFLGCIHIFGFRWHSTDGAAYRKRSTACQSLGASCSCARKSARGVAGRANVRLWLASSFFHLKYFWQFSIAIFVQICLFRSDNSSAC